MKDPLEKYTFKERLELKQQLPSLDKVVQVCCPSCNTPAPSGNININKEVAICDECNGIFSFSNNHLLTQHNNQAIELKPEGVQVFHFQDELDISFKTQPDFLSSIMLIMLIPLSVMLLLGSLKNLTISIPAIVSLFTLLLFSARLYTSMKNKIYISVDHEYLSVTRRPYKLSFGKDQYYNVDEFDQLYVKSKKHPDGSGRDVYIIKAILDGPKGQEHIALTPMIESKSKAKYIEQEIERHLGIVNRPVSEED